MKAKTRSISGAVLMLVIIPILAGLLACMPVPIGDPERSRIDPDISGVWIVNEEGDSGGFYLFFPYDKRTWLLTAAEIEEGSDYAGEPLELGTTEDVIRVLGENKVGAEGITSSGPAVIYKVWRTKLGGKVFMTWESAVGFNKDGSYTPEMWFVFRVEKPDKDHVELYMVNGDHEAFEDLKEPEDGHRASDYPRDIRRQWERALKKVAKHVDDEDLYSDPILLTRLPDDLSDKASELFGEFIEFE